MERIPGPAYRIHTERLILRCWHPQDAPLLKQAIDESVEHLKPWMPWAHSEPEPLDSKIHRLREYRAKFDLSLDFYFGILNPDETQVLGACGLHTREGPDVLEIGYWIHKDHTNNGLATECAAALTRVACEVDCVNRVEIRCDPDNLGSAAIPRKLGFTHEATLRKRRPFLGGFRDVMIWTLLNIEYPSSPAAKSEIDAYDVIGRRLL